MQTSVNMSLTIWNNPDDAYDHNELAANWQALDSHNHTSGKGVQIPSGGIADGAITTNKLGANAVTTTQIANQTILGTDIANGAIGAQQLDNTLFSKLVPLGAVTAWFRPSTSVAVPAGWVIAVGQTLTTGQHGWTSFTNVTLPDLRNAFILGAATSGTGTGPSQPPAENATGGANTRTWNHSHTVPGHSHTVNAHSHTVNDHSHSMPSHSHSISGDGDHNHGMHSRLNAFIQNIQVKDIANNVRSNSLQSLYVAGFNQGSDDVAAPNSGSHSHGGATGAASGTTGGATPGTSNASPGTSSVGLTTDAATAGGDIRPTFVGLLYIMKVLDPS
jgi:hypothetical protein